MNSTSSRSNISLAIPGYTLVEVIYVGARTLVGRSIEQATGRSVILKRLNVENPSEQEVLQFQHQYNITRDLKIASVICPDRLEMHGNHPVLVMADFGGESLRQYQQSRTLSLTLPLSEILTIAVQLAKTLEQIHQQGIIHKDIKPANILIHPESKQIKLIDFSIATRLSQEKTALTNPNQLEGTLAYMSPEQTGRMNRVIDYRTDFYSLGVTLYELLTGKLPFPSQDPLAIVHGHLAQKPIAINEQNPEVPQVIAEIVDKLLAKNAEDRYQSAAGLQADLNRCLKELESTNTIVPFEIGKLDRISQLNIPEKLYGREEQIKTLMAAFERARQGSCELVVVGGYSGVGKSALIQELLKPVTASLGYFVSGKFDQFKRDVPYGCLGQTYGGVIRQILMESPEQVEFWRNHFQTVVKQNGQAVIDVIPELEWLIGPQPPLAELPAAEAMNRFYRTFTAFSIAMSAEYPIVEFMDDLQWVDSTTMAGLPILLQNPEVRHRLIVVAYRDNEVDETHVFMQALAKLRSKGVAFETIMLEPLSLANVMQFTADALGCQTHAIASLAQLLHEKTQGNPFFLSQLLKSLYSQQLLTFNFETAEWEWDIQQIQQQNISDNVVELMIEKLQGLTAETQSVIQLAACIGNTFDLKTLATVYQHSAAQTMAALWLAMQQGFIMPLDQKYQSFLNAVENTSAELAIPQFKFQHDRIQQAAYELIPNDQKQIIHWTIARLLYQSISESELEANLFEIVNHWNCAIEQIDSDAEKTQLAQLNLIAGSKAKSASAYLPALKYFSLGISLIKHHQAAIEKYQLWLELYEGAAETAYGCGEFARMEEYVANITAFAKTPLDSVKSAGLQIQAYIGQNRFAEAIEAGRSALKQLGYRLPESVSGEEIQAAMQEVELLIQAKSTDDLLNLPENENPLALAALRLFSNLLGACYLSGSPLYIIAVLEQVKINLKNGNCALGAVAYGAYLILLNSIQNNLDEAYRFSQISLKLQERYNTKSTQSKVNLPIAVFALPFKIHLRDSLPLHITGFQVGQEVGDLEYMGYHAEYICQCSYLVDKTLVQAEQDNLTYLALLRKLGQINTANYIQIHLLAIQQLIGEQDLALLEQQVSQLYKTFSNSNDFTGLCFLGTHQLAVHYLQQNFTQANQLAIDTRNYLQAGAGQIIIQLFYFYDSLTALSLWSSDIDQSVLLERIHANQVRLKHCADHAPMNFQHKYDLVEAEYCRVEGKIYEAMDLYDRAIVGALENGYIQEAAIANERAAEFYFNLNKPKIAQAYLCEAYQQYQQWGTITKVRQLEKQYPEWLTAPLLSNHYTGRIDIADTHTVTRSNAEVGLLDISTILKATEAIASELVQDKLLDRLLSIILENVGAQKGCIVLNRDGELFIEAADTSQDATEIIVESLPLQQSQTVCIPLIQYVARTQKPLAIADATADPMVAIDPYILRLRPKSILCAPILYQNHLIGVIYLENNQAKDVFTCERLEILQILIGQAATAIENAQLYAREQEKSRQFAQLNYMLKAQQEAELDGILVIDCDRKVISLNRQFVEIWNIPQKVAAARDDQALLSCVLPQLENPQDFIAKIESLHDSNANVRDEIAFKDGRTIERYTSPILSDTQENLGRIWCFRDISDRKRAEIALQESQAQLQNLANNLPGALYKFKMDSQGQASFPFMSNRCRDLFGVEPSLLMDNADAIVSKINPSDLGLFQANVMESLRTLQPFSWIGRFNLASGKQKWIEASSIPAKQADGSIIWDGVMLDVTDRKIAEDQVQQQNQELEQAFAQLQQSQAQVVQAEKMSALGNLVAGVAHEINNPIGFLNGSVKNAQDYVRDLLAHVALYQQHYPNPVVAIQNNAEDIDLEFIHEDLPKLLESMKGANDRIKAISTSLRTFSRADTEHTVPANIHEGIDSTILILKYRLKANEHRPEVEISKNYGNLPKIECFPGQLNQVFMNILANAIDVFDEAAHASSFEVLQAKPQEIMIQTQLLESNQIQITIADNGKGMPEEVRTRIFDHLFTTKGVGKGTGLGLSIARQIIEEKHGGSLIVHSELGQGTKFQINLPINSGIA